jgi:predicted house-cleaning noncanonical NTP pyrophosphatase (MazG superfamily)
MKLVRNKIPQIIKDSGRQCFYYKANPEEMPFLLFAKMREELLEFEEDPCLEEAADLYEVYLSILKAHQLDLCDVIFAAEDKKKHRGGFMEGFVLEGVSKVPTDKVDD